MKYEHFIQAMKIIIQSHSTKVIINEAKPNGQVPSGYTLHIESCVPAVINRLKENDFLLTMKDGLLEVDNINPLQ